MGSTVAALLAEGERAFLSVVEGHVVPLGLPRPQVNPGELFRFVESKRWAYYLRYVARFRTLGANGAGMDDCFDI